MSLREAFVKAMHLQDDGEVSSWLHASGVALADEDTLSRAIHDVTCGRAADHDHPSERDHDQARALLTALRRHGGA